MNFENCMCKNCPHTKECRRENMDILLQVMDNENDVTITDGRGVVLQISDSYEEHYGVSREEIIGKTVYELEENRIFNPSVTAVVIKERKKVTLLQTNRRNESVLTTGIPVFDDRGEMEYVVSFNSIDIANVTGLQDKYNRLKEMMKEYQSQIQEFKTKELEERTFIATSKAMSGVNELLLQVADIDANVLITGETGVGKSMVAKRLHRISGRADGPFAEINCATIPPNLIESELFGYERGAFTGANSKGKIGKIELANRGTLFLDEIGELSLEMQMKLLQVIQEKVIQRVGGLEQISVDFRLVAATNIDLENAIRDRRFREDLYYRLNVISMNIPPLRERREDIIPLVSVFLQKFNRRYNRNVAISSEALTLLEQYDWPGNIRQVENFVERLTVTAKETEIGMEHLPSDFQKLNPAVSAVGGDLTHMMEAYEKEIFIDALKKYKTSIAVGKALGIGQTTAARKLRKYVPGYATDKG